MKVRFKLPSWARRKEKKEIRNPRSSKIVEPLDLEEDGSFWGCSSILRFMLNIIPIMIAIAVGFGILSAIPSIETTILGNNVTLNDTQTSQAMNVTSSMVSTMEQGLPYFEIIIIGVMLITFIITIRKAFVNNEM